MKSLYDRLKKPYKEKLLQNGKKYDTSVHEVLIPVLKEKNRWSALTLDEIDSLITFCEVDTYRWSMIDLRWGELVINKK